jgi:hypothetical protein
MICYGVKIAEGGLNISVFYHATLVTLSLVIELRMFANQKTVT